MTTHLHALVPETADTQPILVGWRHPTRHEPYFQSSHEKSVVGSGKLGSPKLLNKSPAIAYMSITYMTAVSATLRAIQTMSSYTCTSESGWAWRKMEAPANISVQTVENNTVSLKNNPMGY